jgi:small subunit ribosomal protein S16
LPDALDFTFEGADGRISNLFGALYPQTFRIHSFGLVGSRTPLRTARSAHHLQEQKHLATKIRLMRMGKIRTPYYRIVVTDSRKARNGLSIEEIGRYSPGQEPSFIEVNSERALYWLGVGALPTPAVEAILKVTGDWQKHKDLPGKEGTLRHAEPRVHKSVAYEAAVKASMNEPKEGATTLKKKAQEKLAAKSAPVVETPSVDVIEPTAVESAATEPVAVESTEPVVESTEPVVESTEPVVEAGE